MALPALLEPFRPTRPEGTRAGRPHGMHPREIERLVEIIHGHGCKAILEIGMATGSSTVAMLKAVQSLGGGRVTSIDPFQFKDDPALGDDYYGIRGAGVRNVAAAGLAPLHSLIPEFDHIALPRLAADQANYDLVLIDGSHSFELTFLDFFYADRMIRPGGICVFHDSGTAAVFKVTQFARRNKAYVPVGPAPVQSHDSLACRALRRVAAFVNGNAVDFRERRLNWGGLAAFCKMAEGDAPECAIDSFQNS
jgi:predicted O-methyltransferase YrrM